MPPLFTRSCLEMQKLCLWTNMLGLFSCNWIVLWLTQYIDNRVYMDTGLAELQEVKSPLVHFSRYIDDDALCWFTKQSVHSTPPNYFYSRLILLLKNINEQIIYTYLLFPDRFNTDYILFEWFYMCIIGTRSFNCNWILTPNIWSLYVYIIALIINRSYQYYII